MKKKKIFIWILVGMVTVFAVLLAVLLIKHISGNRNDHKMQKIGISLELPKDFISELAILDAEYGRSPFDDAQKAKVEHLKTELREKYPVEWQRIEDYQKGYSDGLSEGVKNGMLHERANNFSSNYYKSW